MKRFLRSTAAWSFASISLLTATGCSTIFGPKQPYTVEFKSTPEGGAGVATETGKAICKTPCRHTFPPALRSEKITAQLEGYSSVPQLLRRRIHFSFWFNFAGLIGFPIDMITGNLWALSPRVMTFKMVSNEGEEVNEEPAAAPEEPAAPKKYKRIPDTPQLRRIKEVFPESYLADQVRYYYGEPANIEERFKVYDHIYLELIAADNASERLDVDEAIRRDLVKHPNP